MIVNCYHTLMPSRQPTLRQLSYFIAVSESANYHRAAARMQVSQPTITTQIQTLENLLGCKLFERARSGIMLTPTARVLLPLAKQILDAVGNLEMLAAATDDGPAGTYKLGIPPTLGPYYLPHILPHLHQQFPRLQLYCREQPHAQLEAGLLDGEHDLIISTLPLTSEQTSSRLLFHEAFHLVVSNDHSLAAQNTISKQKLVGEKLLILEEQHHLHKLMQDFARELSTDILYQYAGTSLDTLRQMIGLNMGVALLPGFYIDSEIITHADPQVAVIRIHDYALQRGIYISWRNRSPNRVFFQQLAELLKNLQHSGVNTAQTN
jgi:LysR family transcriptional regulator, hydrogen peroxide-inducible genes activator